MKFGQYSQLAPLCSGLADEFHSPGIVVRGFERLEEWWIRDIHDFKKLTRRMWGSFSFPVSN
jgi:hypothetical protein